MVFLKERYLVHNYLKKCNVEGIRILAWQGFWRVQRNFICGINYSLAHYVRTATHKSPHASGRESRLRKPCRSPGERNAPSGVFFVSFLLRLLCQKKAEYRFTPYKTAVVKPPKP